MLFNKSVSIDEKGLGKVALATGEHSVQKSGETEFIERLKQGEPRAFDTLVNRFSGDIYGLLLRITRDPEEASDLTQETFLRALKGIQKFRGDSGIKTWLFRIAINQSKNRFRWWKSRRRDKTVSLDAPVGDSQTTVGEMIPGKGNSPEAETLLSEQERILFEMLSELPDIFREAIILCDIQGLTYQEMSEVLEISIGTVKSRISRGREELRKRVSLKMNG